jgi:D-3-phosphoglycerate dehydrogenase
VTTDPIVFKITDYIERDLEWEDEECRKLGLRFEHFQLKEAPAAEIVRHVGDADIVLVNMARFTREVIAGLARAKVIIRHGIGYDNVDVPAATDHGIILANESTASSEDVAEHAILLMLSAYKKKNIQDRILRDWIETGVWSSKRIFPLYRLHGKTVGVVGCGNIGSRVIKKLKGFDVKILACDPYLSARRWADLGLPHTPLEELLGKSDIVTIHVPVNDETRGMFNLEKFGLMKKTAVVVNTARGPIIKTGDLVEALQRGLIAGVGIDVFEKEPPPAGFELLKMDNAVVSPHIAWYSEEGGQDIRVMIMDDVKAILKGKPPRHVVNKEVLSAPNLRLKIKG